MSPVNAYVQSVIIVLLAVVIGITANLVRKKPIPWIAVKPKVTFVGDPIGDTTAQTPEENTRIDTSFVESSNFSEEIRGITLNQVYNIYQKQPSIIIDARQPEDYSAGHIVTAINIPYDRVAEPEYAAKLSTIAVDKVIIVYCDGTECDASKHLAAKLKEQGYKHVFVFVGGWIDWLEAGYPIESTW